MLIVTNKCYSKTYIGPYLVRIGTHKFITLESLIFFPSMHPKKTHKELIINVSQGSKY